MKWTKREEIVDHNDSQSSNKKAMLSKKKYLHEVAKVGSKAVDQADEAKDYPEKNMERLYEKQGSMRNYCWHAPKKRGKNLNI